MAVSLRPEERGGGEFRSVREYVQQFAKLGAEKFAERHPYPVLLAVSSGKGESLLDFDTALMSPEALSALREQAEDRISLVSAAGRLSAGDVLPIVKRPGGVFAERIGVGRARNADVCLPVPRVSKYHAFFARCPDGSYTLTDAGSKNGTSVDGTPLAPREPTPVADAAEVSFGPYRFVFYGRAAFCAMLARRARAEAFDL